jgi:Spy/CpxP family protein refolding chaperone
MRHLRPGTTALSLAALLFAAPALGQVTPPPPQRGQQAPRPAVGDSTQVAAIRARAGEVIAAMQGRGPGPDDFSRFLFPPELVMQHQRDIGITDQQRTTITGAIQRLESDVVALQWKMADEQQKLTELVRATPIDSAATLAQIDKVLDLERQIKKGHLLMLVRIKNALTVDQQHALRQFGPGRPMNWMEPQGRGERGRGEGMPPGGRGRRGGGPGGPGDSPEHN